MAYSVSCSCGNALAVDAVDAGSTLVCRCGTAVAIPALSELRRLAGQSSYPVGIADKLLAMSAAGELPVEHTCLECGIGTSNILNCRLVCETAYVKKHSIWMILGWICLSPLVAMRFSMAADKAAQQDRDVIVPVPLRLCLECVNLVKYMNRIMPLLRESPLYAELLKAYPYAELQLE